MKDATQIKEESIPTEKKVVGTQISIETYNQLVEIAERDFMSISDVLRKIIILYLRGEKEKSK